MATYILLGRYSTEAINGISAARTSKATELAGKFNGSVTSVYALFGKNDLLLITDFPGMGHAMKFSVALTRLTGISFSTSEAVGAAEFDKLMAEV
jgi:uncharacterized protein with GYD domain